MQGLVLICLISSSCKPRRPDTTALVRKISETFIGLRLTQQTAFRPQKAMLAG